MCGNCCRGGPELSPREVYPEGSASFGTCAVKDTLERRHFLLLPVGTWSPGGKAPQASAGGDPAGFLPQPCSPETRRLGRKSQGPFVEKKRKLTSSQTTDTFKSKSKVCRVWRHETAEKAWEEMRSFQSRRM